MSITMYSASVPIFVRQLGCMSNWLDKGQAHAEARKYDPSLILATRLTPDMLPLVSQIRIASDTAKGCVARLAGDEIPKFEDNEATLDDCRERIRKTLAYVQSVPAQRLEGSGNREIVIPMRTRDPIRFDGHTYLRHWVLPNFMFHCTTAYALLRHAGVELGKADFLGAV